MRRPGAPGIDTRLMVALHYLKYQHDLSDEEVVARWTETPPGSTSAAGSFSNTKCRSIPRR
jgi:hypothetical protein